MRVDPYELTRKKRKRLLSAHPVFECGQDHDKGEIEIVGESIPWLAAFVLFHLFLTLVALFCFASEIPPLSSFALVADRFSENGQARQASSSNNSPFMARAFPIAVRPTRQRGHGAGVWVCNVPPLSLVRFRLACISACFCFCVAWGSRARMLGGR